MIKERWPIKKQLVWAFVLVMVISILLTLLTWAAGVSFLFSNQWLQPANYYESQIPEIQQKVQEQARHKIQWTDTANQAKLEQLLPPEGITYQVVDTRGTRRYGTIQEQVLENETDLLSRLNSKTVTDSTLGFGGLVTLISPLSGERGTYSGALVLQYRLETSPSPSVSPVWTNTFLVLMLASPFVYIAAATWFMAGRVGRNVKRPIEDLILASKRIKEQDLDFALDNHAPNELGLLSASFEDMRKELKSALTREWKLQQERSELMGAISHDFRTPMTVIQGHVELLKDSPKHVVQNAESISSHLDVIDHNVKRINRLIQDMTVAAGTDFDYFPLRREPVDPSSFWEMKQREVRFLCSSQGVQSEFRLVDRRLHTSSPLLLDVQRVGQVLDNLVANSLRYVPPKGEIRLDVDIQNSSLMQVTVCDTGPGFTEADLQHLFDQFYHGHQGQTGLGLFTAKRIVEKHGGTINAGNLPKGGACITFTLDIGQSSPGSFYS
ncbi:HAMP domain-containing sensor histidine kinase [Paenibacillus xylanilyticus]|uniref:histidine kinase n=1 Tax=Paenibacillus xylanilyticus TaxID=248903 RepID=A0A7Y6ETW3_9BACL|nr:ATP-binding protein [Paenibacillus xylanilyticus]NUU74079.1 HAMP domain-containing protein [Paenibacillus xylanilyticus]